MTADDSATKTVCPGCGLQTTANGSIPDARYNASGECWDVYCELSAYTLSRGYSTFIHQHAVDAYNLQHAVGTASNIGTAFSLIGLYLAVERGFSGRAVQRAHMALASKRKQWPKLERPQTHAELTVIDVMRAEAGESRDALIMQWAAAVWTNWSDAHDWTRRICQQMLDVRSDQ
jgi:hypothetical protein